MEIKSRLKNRKCIEASVVRIMFLAFLVGILHVSSISAAGKEVTEQERVCYEFLNILFNIQLEDAKEILQEIESDILDIVAEDKGDENQNDVIGYDSRVLQSFIEEKFVMLDDKAKERVIKNRVILWPYQKSCEMDSNILILSQTIEEDIEERTYRYEVEVLFGLSIQVVKGTITLESENDQWVVSDFSIYEK